jgi:hypothetical protein
MQLRELRLLAAEHQQLQEQEAQLLARIRTQQQLAGLQDPLAPTHAPAQAQEQLVVAVNTIPRPEDKAYLLRCLDSFAQQLPARGVTVYVLNLRPGKHAVFARARSQHADGAHSH